MRKCGVVCTNLLAGYFYLCLSLFVHSSDVDDLYLVLMKPLKVSAVGAGKPGRNMPT